MSAEITKNSKLQLWINARKKISIIVIASLVLITTYLHYSTIPEIHSLHNIFSEIYYIPVLIGALEFGLTGAVTTYLLVFVLYLPFLLDSWTGLELSEANSLLHIILQGMFAVLAGLLIDRDRARTKQSEKDRYLAGIGQFATTIVHDLKNPLIAIVGFANRMKDGKGKAETSLQCIIDSANHMQKIVHNVLDFAKPVRLELKHDDIGTLIARVCNSCRIKADQKNIIFKITLPDEPAILLMDSLQIERAFANMVSNAIEASGKSEKISIDVVRDNHHVAVKIKDNGSGMDRETIENIFIPFYTTKKKGTGLGMAIARKIITEHKGRILIESTIGAGTEVTAELPHQTVGADNVKGGQGPRETYNVSQ